MKDKMVVTNANGLTGTLEAIASLECLHIDYVTGKYQLFSSVNERKYWYGDDVGEGKKGRKKGYSHSEEVDGRDIARVLKRCDPKGFYNKKERKLSHHNKGIVEYSYREVKSAEYTIKEPYLSIVARDPVTREIVAEMLGGRITHLNELQCHFLLPFDRFIKLGKPRTLAVVITGDNRNSC